tara:strand:- start:402 stop:578 length:177 start_codon:yes stop_codon:yes gene_type:complete
MIVNEELYKRMILHIAEHNNCYSDEIEKIYGISWIELHDLRREIEATGLEYSMLGEEE